jgi:type VI secretion system protein ImpA
LLAPVSTEDPCGPDIGGAVEYVLLQQEYYALAGADGDADPSAWRKLAQSAESLLRKSKDVWLAVFLLNGLLRSDGLGGLRDGLTLLSGLLATYWESVHPRKDQEDDYPIQRVNAIADLNAFSFLKAVRQAALVRSAEHGAVTIRELLLAHGDLNLPADSEQTKPDADKLMTVLRDVAVRDSGQVDDVLRTLDACSDGLKKIADVQRGHVGADAELLTDLNQLVARATQFVRAAKDGVPPPDKGQGDGNKTDPAAPAAPGEIRSRADVVTAINRICEFYRQNEPASPVPLLLRRAERLVHMDFLEIVQELAPESLEAVHKLGGVTPEPLSGG